MTNKGASQISTMLLLFGATLLVGILLAVFAKGCSSGPVQKALENGTAFEEKGQFVEAMVEYNRAIELDPKNTDAYYNRALLYRKQGNSKAALEDFDKIISINPNYSEPYYGRGQIYDEQGKKSKAIADYTKAIENNSNYKLAYYKRCMAYQSQGEYRKALDDAQKAKGMGFNISEDFLRQLEAGAK
jgi:tetratricopeptide (TPR) repeat protein